VPERAPGREFAAAPLRRWPIIGTGARPHNRRPHGVCERSLCCRVGPHREPGKPRSGPCLEWRPSARPGMPSLPIESAVRRGAAQFRGITVRCDRVRRRASATLFGRRLRCGCAARQGRPSLSAAPNCLQQRPISDPGRLQAPHGRGNRDRRNRRRSHRGYGRCSERSECSPCRKGSDRENGADRRHLSASSRCRVPAIRAGAAAAGAPGPTGGPHSNPDPDAPKPPPWIPMKSRYPIDPPPRRSALRAATLPAIPART